MASRSRLSWWRRPPATAWIVVGAIAFGLCAALLASPTAPSQTAPTSFEESPSSAITLQTLGEVSVVIVVALFAGVIGLRFTSKRAGGVNRYVLQTAIVLLLLLAFVIAARFVVAGGLSDFGILPGSSPPPGASSPNTVPSPGFPTCNATNGSCAPPPGNIAWPSVRDTSVILAVLTAGIVSALFVVPYLVARREARQVGPARPAPPETLHLIDQTIAELEGSSDPRAVVIALYAKLMRLVEPRLGDLAARTPREIEQESMERLGLRGEAARSLTRVFEEARYSSRPLPPATVERARAALAALRAEIASTARGGGAPSRPAPAPAAAPR